MRPVIRSNAGIVCSSYITFSRVCDELCKWDPKHFSLGSAVYNFDKYSLIISSGLVSARLKMSAYSELSETLSCSVPSSLESEVFHLDPVLVKN